MDAIVVNTVMRLKMINAIDALISQKLAMGVEIAIIIQKKINLNVVDVKMIIMLLFIIHINGDIILTLIQNYMGVEEQIMIQKQIHIHAPIVDLAFYSSAMKKFANLARKRD